MFISHSGTDTLASIVRVGSSLEGQCVSVRACECVCVCACMCVCGYDMQLDGGGLIARSGEKKWPPFTHSTSPVGAPAE